LYSKYLAVPCIFSFFSNMTRSVEAGKGTGSKEAVLQLSELNAETIIGTDKDKIQFHPAGAPVPLSMIRDSECIKTWRKIINSSVTYRS
jgi:hypothetical protein